MKRKMFRKIVLVLIVLLIVAIPFNLRANGESTVSAKYEKVTVYPGDTLWSIAKDNLKGNKDIRKVIYDIRKINKLQSAVISPGQELLIPTK